MPHGFDREIELNCIQLFLYLQARDPALVVRMEPEVMQAGASPGALQGTTTSEVGLELKPGVSWGFSKGVLRASVWLGRLEPNHIIFSSIASAQFASFPTFVQLLFHV